MEAQLSRAARVFKDVSKSLKEQAQEFMSNDTPLEKQLKEATANTNWGCANSILGEISRAANDYHDYNVIMKHAWEALASKPKYWRRVFKALTLLEYLIRHGPERVVDEVRDCLYRLKSLSGFHYTDEGRDRGGGARKKAKQIIDLVSDTELLRAEREKARQNRDRYVGIGAHGEMTGHIGGDYTGFGNSDYQSSINRYPEYPGSRGALRSSMNERPDQDAEREQKRIVAEREKARLQREKQKEKSLKKQASQDQRPAKRAAKKSDICSIDSSSSSSSSSEDSALQRPRRKLTDKKSSKSTPNSFNTDAGWGSAPSTMSTPGSGFAPGCEAFPAFGALPFLPPQQAVPSQSSRSFPSQTQMSQAPGRMSQAPARMSQTPALMSPVSIVPKPNSSLPDFFSYQSHSQMIPQHSQLDQPSTFVVHPSQVMIPQHSQLAQPSSFVVNPSQQKPPSVHSLMAQNLANFSSLGQSTQQSSRNPFGQM